MRLFNIAFLFLGCLTTLLANALPVVGAESDAEITATAARAAAVDYLIIGAGSSGLQMALFLQRNNLTYTVLEKNHVVGSFWTSFPVFDELISVNKWVRNETQRMRYDWHSLLQTPLRMQDVTEEYFPTGKSWQEYMTRVAEESGVMKHIEFGVEVQQIATSNDRATSTSSNADSAAAPPCVVISDGTTRCAKYRIFVGTGLEEKPEPLLRAMGGTPYSEITKDMARHKRVCIAGNGNSGFEVAQNIYGVADRVIVYGRQPHRLSSITRYTGDVRVKYLQALENLNGKLLDMVDYHHWTPKIQGLDRVLNSSQIDVIKDAVRTASWIKFWKCELFVIATGFQSRVPGALLGADERFPAVTNWWQSVEHPSVHYIGWLMHGEDFRKGAGGFFSGFRYLIRNLFLHVHEEDKNVPYPVRSFSTKDEIAAHALGRIQTADDLIIMQDGGVLRDIVLLPTEDHPVYRYYEGVNHKFHDNLRDVDDDNKIISLFFAWGDKGKTAINVFNGVIRYSDTSALLNVFLHPAIEVGGLRRDMQEDLEHGWFREEYKESCLKTIGEALDGNLTLFRPRPGSLPYKKPHITQKEGIDFEPARIPAHIDHDFVTALWQTVNADFTPDMVKILETAAEKSLPWLFQSEISVEETAGTCSH